jgi:hypothetical protein
VVGGALSRFDNPLVPAFTGDRLIYKAHVFFREGARFEGEVRLLGAQIGGTLDCSGGSFINPEGRAFNGDGLAVKEDVFFGEGAKFEGEVRLLGAQIGGQLSLRGGEFISENAIALLLEDVGIRGVIFIDSINSIKGHISLNDASVGVLCDDDKYWNHNQTIFLDGFSYGRIHCDDSKLLTAKERLRWLALQPKDSFHPQPYDQLAKVFRNMGQEKDARDILIAKQKERRKYLGWWPLRFWSLLLYLTTGYGYQMWRALLFAIAFILLGYLNFDNAYRAGLMNPTKLSNSGKENTIEYIKEKMSYPSFSPVIYSVDAFLPIVDLHQESHWLPKSDDAGATYIWIYLWFHIMMGWLLTTLVVASIGGVVRRE